MSSRDSSWARTTSLWSSEALIDLLGMRGRFDHENDGPDIFFVIISATLSERKYIIFIFTREYMHKHEHIIISSTTS